VTQCTILQCSAHKFRYRQNNSVTKRKSRFGALQASASKYNEFCFLRLPQGQQPIRAAGSNDVLNFVMACADNMRRGFDEKLINVVRRYRVLYGVTLKEFKNISAKDSAWAEVLCELGDNGMHLAQCRFDVYCNN